MGCMAKGCLILCVFLIFIGLAGVGGVIFGLRVVKSSYFPTSRVHLPEVTSTQEEQDAANAKWNEFEQAAREKRQAHLEMTADEVNALIASNPELRGNAMVSIENEVATLRLSFPLDRISWMRGRYANAECTVQSAENGNPGELRIANVRLNDKPVEDEYLNWRGPWSLRRALERWTERENLTTLEIRDGRVVLESSGSR